MNTPEWVTRAERLSGVVAVGDRVEAAAVDRIEWEEYRRVGPATAEEVDLVESSVGHKFPADLRQALLEYQGMIPRPNKLAMGSGQPQKGFGALGHCRQGKSGNIARLCGLMRNWGDDPYPEWLVPISTSKGQSHFALDYRGGEEQPPIVYVDTDLGSDDPDFVTPVASSFTELLEMME